MNQEEQTLLTLFQSGQKENMLLAEQLAIAAGIDLLALLQPYQVFLLDEAATLEAYQSLFCNSIYNVFNQGIQQLPTQLGHLQQLREIYLEDNYLNEVPDCLLCLPNLQILNLKRNNLQHLPLSFPRWNLLSYLYLEGNKLEDIPPSIGALHHLTVLNLSRNKIKTLPAAIGQCSQLSHLHLSANQLLYLPEEIGNWEQLEWLDLSYNNLYSLPDTIGQLKNLQHLDLTNNPIDYLPESLKELKQLKELIIHQTPISPTEQDYWARELPHTKIKVNFDYLY